MAQSSDSLGGVEASPQVAEQQRSDSSWPRPGEEGFVHPTGTPQSVQQLEDNRRAAADRAAAGSGVHGAPAQGGGGVEPDHAGAADAYSGPTVAERDADHTDWVAEKHAEVLDEQAAASESAAPADASAEGRHEAAAEPIAPGEPVTVERPTS